MVVDNKITNFLENIYTVAHDDDVSDKFQRIGKSIRNKIKNIKKRDKNRKNPSTDLINYWKIQEDIITKAKEVNDISIFTSPIEVILEEHDLLEGVKDNIATNKLCSIDINLLKKFDDEQENIGEGDMVVIKNKVFEYLKNHCDHGDVPTHNHGVVLKTRLEYRYTSVEGMCATIQLPDGREENIMVRDLIKLY